MSIIGDIKNDKIGKLLNLVKIIKIYAHFQKLSTEREMLISVKQSEINKPNFAPNLEGCIQIF